MHLAKIDLYDNIWIMNKNNSELNHYFWIVNFYSIKKSITTNNLKDVRVIKPYIP